MCGIVAYIGKNKNPWLGIKALKRLEYRGYDSAGMAVFQSLDKEIFVLKSVGRISKLEAKFKKYKEAKGNAFILHTRWATHGEVNEINAHPHCDCQKNIFLVHNGIIENYKELKQRLISEGHHFSSETDTEVLAHLIERFFQGNLEQAVRKALSFVRGSYALAIMAKQDPEKIVAVRCSSPLLVGLGKDEFIIASDPAAIVARTKKVVYLKEKEMAVIKPSNFFLSDLKGNKKEKVVDQIDWRIEEAEKGEFPHFMLKEIFESPEVIENTLRGRIIPDQGLVKLGGLELVQERLNKIKRIVICGCGTSYLAGLVGEYLIEEYGGLPVEVEYSSEFRYRQTPLDDQTAFIFLSQSGETADTLAALRKVKEKGNLALGIVNVVGSSIARETDAGVYNYAGPEIGVASTKVFVSQLVVFALLSLFFGRPKFLNKKQGQRIIEELKVLPQKVDHILRKKNEIDLLAQKYCKFDNFFFIGRNHNLPIALEGALKLKELSYLHAEGYGGGELKHGPLALIDQTFPTFAIAPRDKVYEKMLSNLQEIKARKGPIVSLATQGDRRIRQVADHVFYLPSTLEMLTPILNVIPLQLFAYSMAVLRGEDPDKPRNLAKSVTVE